MNKPVERDNNKKKDVWQCFFFSFLKGKRYLKPCYSDKWEKKINKYTGIQCYTCPQYKI